MFDYDWFHGPAFVGQENEARMRCTLSHFPNSNRESLEEDDAARRFFEEIQVRRLVYLRDGFSYEVREVADPPSKTHFTFECEPVDEQYKVGAFVVSIPFDEIVRVEVFAVHPSEKPDDGPQITGFRSRPDRHAPPPQEEG